MNLGSFGFGSGAGTPSGMISGGGSAPKIPKFTAASIIGDSQMSDNGTTVFIGASATSTSAVFEVNSTTKGVLFPRVTTAQRNAITVNAAANSLFVYNTTISQYQYYDHTTTSWKTIDNGLDGIYSGSGIVPAGTTATITNYIAFNGGEFRTENGYWQGTSKILYINPNGTIANLFVGESSGNNTMTNSYNTAVGANSLRSNTTGSQNTAIGWDALRDTTSGYVNVAIGSAALRENINGWGNIAVGEAALGKVLSGSRNVGIGRNALYYNLNSDNIAIGDESMNRNTTGYSNIAVGSLSLRNNTTGIANTAIAANTLYSNTTGLYNVAIGYGSSQNGTTASYNTAIGYQALYSNTTGVGSVALGAYAGYYETGSNKLFIDNTARANEADGRAKALIYGIFNAATANQYLNINANTNTPLTHYNYMAASNSADTVGDVRTYATYVGTVSTFFTEKCTVANATKGGGTWVVINNNYFFAASDETSPLIADAVNAAYTDYLPYAMTVQSVMINVNTAPTDANIIVDIHKNGVTIFTTLISINATENTSLTATTPYVLDGTITFAQGDKLEAFITQVGSTIAGTGLKVKLL